jgi:hypothetical protein
MECVSTLPVLFFVMTVADVAPVFAFAGDLRVSLYASGACALSDKHSWFCPSLFALKSRASVLVWI